MTLLLTQPTAGQLLLIVFIVGALVFVSKVGNLKPPKMTVILLLIGLNCQAQSDLFKKAANSPFDRDLFIKCAKTLCREPEMVIAQAAHETGWFKSEAFLKSNNLFGMKLTRNGYAKGFNGTYATYANWFDSLLDYAQWQNSFYKGQNYIRFIGIDKKYASDPKYAKKIYAMRYCNAFKLMIKS